MRPAARLARNQRCEISRADIQRQVHQQLLATLFGEEVDDAIERLVGAVGVQGRQHQVAGFGELNAVLHRVAIADFADQDHVGRLAQRVLQRHVPALRVDADFAMRDDAALVVVHVLDRIFDGDDVAAGLFVAVVQHRGERGRLTRTRAADDDDQAALGHDDIFQNRRQLHFFERRDLRVDRTHHAADQALLHERADAETADADRRDGEVTFLGRVELACVCLSFMIERTSTALCSGVSTRSDCGRISPSILMAGGKPEVMNRSEPLRSTRRLQQVLHQFDSLFAFHGDSAP